MRVAGDRWVAEPRGTDSIALLFSHGPSTASPVTTGIEEVEVLAVEKQIRLRQLQAERQLAAIEGLAGDRACMADLEDEIEAARQAYVGAAVTEIALLRAELSGRQVG